MRVRRVFIPSLCAIMIALSGTSGVAAQSTSVTSPATSTIPSATSRSDGSITGVGNAGSFGIGSGTADGKATATAVSNGLTDNSVDNSSHNGMAITTIATQDLQSATTNNQVTITQTGSSSAPVMQTGSNALTGQSFANYVGILNNGWNTAPSGNAVAASNIAINGGFGSR